jgi:hypothetical protein
MSAFLALCVIVALLRVDFGQACESADKNYLVRMDGVAEPVTISAFLELASKRPHGELVQATHHSGVTPASWASHNLTFPFYIRGGGFSYADRSVVMGVLCGDEFGWLNDLFINEDGGGPIRRILELGGNIGAHAWRIMRYAHACMENHAICACMENHAIRYARAWRIMQYAHAVELFVVCTYGSTLPYGTVECRSL